MSDFEYESLLDRARSNIPEEISNRARWTLPDPQILIEGSNTIFRNFTEVVNHMERDEVHVYQFMLNELGTAGSRDGPRVRFKGRILQRELRKLLSIMSTLTSNVFNVMLLILISSSKIELLC